MKKAALSFPWHELGRLVRVTLTYPDDFPYDGRVVKRQFVAWQKRFVRQYGGLRGLWVLEFQDRGAPHIHLLMGMPQYLEYEDFCWWGFNVWSEIAGFNSQYGPIDTEHHWRMGLRFNVSEMTYARAQKPVEVAEYLWSEAGKARQKQVPEGFVRVGRFWGVLGAGVREPRQYFCCEAAYFIARRVVLDLRVRKMRQFGRIRSRFGGRYRNSGGRSKGGGWAEAAGGLVCTERLRSWAMTECGCGVGA